MTKKEIKEDKFVTYYFKSIDYMNQNSRMVSGVVLGVLAVVILITFMVRSKRTEEMSAAFEVTKARVQVTNNNADMAVDILKTAISNYGGANCS